MTLRGLFRLLAAWAVFVAIGCVAIARWASLAPVPAAEQIVVETTWRGGDRVGRRVRTRLPTDDAPQGEEVVEIGVAEAPLPALFPLLELTVVPGMDGVRATYEKRTAVVTVDDLLKDGAYDRSTPFAELGLGIGTDRQVILAHLAAQLGVTAREVEARASFRRVRMERRVPRAKPAPPIRAAELTPALVRDRMLAAARYLGRGQDDHGRYRYQVSAASNQTIAGYNLPRHAGATFFMAQAAGVTGDAGVRWGTLMAAQYMRAETMGWCGEHRCIVDDGEANAGSSALAVIAMSEIVLRGIDASYERDVRELSAFLRSLQRPDGELMHVYDQAAKRPIDVQRLYFSGEAALALARAHRITKDPADLEAARRLLARLAGPGWSFFGSRYYWGEEHWTCQAMAELWDRAPSEEALEFCRGWHRYQRKLQYGPGDSPMDADGAFGFGSMVSPRLTPASSRGEACGATLAAMRKAHPDDPENAELSRELDRAVAFVLRHQLAPGPSHLFSDPNALAGAMPGSPVDWTIRMDYPQHAGSMMVRWLELNAR